MTGGFGRPGKKSATRVRSPVTGSSLKSPYGKIRVILIGYGGLKTDAVRSTKTRVRRVSECECQYVSRTYTVTVQCRQSRDPPPGCVLSPPPSNLTLDISLDVKFSINLSGVLT